MKELMHNGTAQTEHGIELLRITLPLEHNTHLFLLFEYYILLVFYRDEHYLYDDILAESSVNSYYKILYVISTYATSLMFCSPRLSLQLPYHF